MIELQSAATIKQLYDSNNLIKAYVDLHHHLSLVNADISPEPKDQWLHGLSAAVLDYWKIGECHIADHEGLFVSCDPTKMVASVSSATSGSMFQFEAPDDWRKAGYPEPVPVLNKSNPYSQRGESVVHKYAYVIAKNRKAGHNETLSHVTFGFGNHQAVMETVQEVQTRVMQFRKKLGKALNRVWPDLVLDLYAVSGADVIREAKNFGLIPEK